MENDDFCVAIILPDGEIAYGQPPDTVRLQELAEHPDPEVKAKAKAVITRLSAEK
jgi:hypothetical protein